jgi:hypothetical protein
MDVSREGAEVFLPKVRSRSGITRVLFAGALQRRELEPKAV